VLVDSVCTNLDQDTNLCTVHGTPDQPRTCVCYNPHTCWYRPNVREPLSDHLVRLTPRSLDRLLGQVVFGPEGAALTPPTFERVVAAAHPVVREL
jgi:hypothetical protein